MSAVQWVSRRTKKQKIIGGITLCVIILAAILSLYTYSTWRQQAEKAVLESVLGALTSSSVSFDGTFKSHSSTNEFELTFKGGSGASQGMADAELAIRTPQTGVNLTLKGAVAYSADDMYFKVQDARAAYDHIMAKTIEQTEKQATAQGAQVTTNMKTKMKEQYDTMLLPLVTTIDNKWVKLTSADADALSAGSVKVGYECISRLMDRVRKDQKVSDELRSLYEKNRFIAVVDQLDVNNGTIGYGATINTSKFERFGQEIEKMSIFGDMKQCQSAGLAKNISNPQGSATGQSNATDDKKQRLEIRMTESTHALTSVKVITDSARGSEKATSVFDLGIKLNQPIQFDLPKQTVPFSDVKAGLDALQAQMTTAATGAR